MPLESAIEPKGLRGPLTPNLCPSLPPGAGAGGVGPLSTPSVARLGAGARVPLLMAELPCGDWANSFPGIENGNPLLATGRLLDGSVLVRLGVLDRLDLPSLLLAESIASQKSPLYGLMPFDVRPKTSSEVEDFRRPNREPLPLPCRIMSLDAKRGDEV